MQAEAQNTKEPGTEKPVLHSSPLAQRQAWLDQYRFGLRVAEQGSVVSVGDGIA